jgi:hypothetical protein
VGSQKKAKAKASETPSLPLAPIPFWQEGAGGFLLLAALHQTGLATALLPTIQTCLAQAQPHLLPFSRSQLPTLSQLVNTLLFLPVVGLPKPFDLRSYTGKGLALLSGRSRAYGYEYTERFLSQLAKSEAVVALNEKLAHWTAQLWLTSPASQTQAHQLPLLFYLDGHHKAVYSDKLIPRGLVGRLGKILGNRALMLLHDHKGHPLLATTSRGDTHLTLSLPQNLALYEKANPTLKLKHLVVDREGMAGSFLEQLVSEGRSVVTILRQDQYSGLASFSEVGQFEPYSYDRKGQLKRELASARFELKIAEGRTMNLKVALLREVRPTTILAEVEDEAKPASKLAASSKIKEDAAVPRLIPIVSAGWTAELEARELVRIYGERWVRQENIIRDWWLPVGLDCNYGYAKTSVENSEMQHRREKLQAALVNSQRFLAAARLREHQAGERYLKLNKRAHQRDAELNRDLVTLAQSLRAQGLSEPELSEKLKAQQQQNRAELDQLLEKEWQAFHHNRVEWKKVEDYQKRQQTLEAELKKLEEQAREMSELDNRKDQIMTSLKLGLVNLGMWLREKIFPASYAGATWPTLAAFFKLGGFVFYQSEKVEVELEGFNDRQLNRALAEICEKVREAELKLGDGRKLVLRVKGVQKALEPKKEATSLSEATTLALVA